jgi:hypothetical protein
MAHATNGNSINPNEIFAQASRTMEAAMKAAVKIQEESTKWFTDMINEIGTPQKWQKKTQSVMEESLGVTQKNLDEMVQVMNQNTKASLELFQKAADLRQEKSSTDPQAVAREWWETALSTVRMNTQTLMQANARVLESWAELAKKFNGRTIEAVESMTQHAEDLTKQSQAAVQEAMKQGE